MYHGSPYRLETVRVSIAFRLSIGISHENDREKVRKGWGVSIAFRLSIGISLRKTTHRHRGEVLYVSIAFRLSIGISP